MQSALRNSGTSRSAVLVLSGAYEFVQDQPAKQPTRKRLAFLAKAYEGLHNDLLFVTPEERQIMARGGVKPASNWGGSTRVETHVLGTPNGAKIGVVLLPPLPASDQGLPERYVHLMENAVSAIRAKVGVVVVMSPWGYQKEQRLLEQANHRALPDILLGSGPGIGQVGVLAANGRTAWIRAFAQGKSVHRIDILAFPENNSTFTWTEQKNIRMSLIGLTEQYHEDSHMLMLMQQMGTD
jgi:hypothetical protein